MDVRPNQLYAISLDYSPVEDMVKSDVVMTVNNELVTRRGIRTLSPRNVMYRGVYEGSQTDRDLAYYQGCSFPVLLDPYVNVCFKMMGPNFYKKAEYLTEGFYADINKHGVGAFSELYDGDPPHEAHGAIASACSTAALLRVDYNINKNMNEENFAYKVRHALNEKLDDMPETIARRLEQARLAALGRKKTMPL